MHTNNWMIEFRGLARANMYPIERTIVDTTSEYQKITIAETTSHGVALFLDGIPQSAALDEHIYHECLIHPAMVACPQPTKVFIAGGGEGAVLREILRHNTVEKVVMVDIDKVLIDLVKEHLYDWHQGAFDDPRVEVYHTDARAYLEQSSETYDCIFGDLPDPVEDSPAAPLFTTDFFDLVKSRLNPGGVYALQSEDTEIGWCRAFAVIQRSLKQSFQAVQPYQSNLSFYGLPWGFAVAGEAAIQERLTPEAVEHTLRERGCTGLQFYDAETHQHMFALPRYLRDALEDPSNLRNAFRLAIE